MPTKKIVVFYHADCTDGFTAAWVAHKKFGNKADYISCFHENEPPKIKGRDIYMLDMTFPKPITERLMKDNKRVTAIDHHISVKSITLSTHKPLYALNHSGCVLAWKYFFSNKPIPTFLLSIEDVDLWNHKVKGSADLYSYLDLLDFKFNVWTKVISDFANLIKRKKILEMGKLISLHQEKMRDKKIEDNARLVKLDGYVVYAINNTGDSSFMGAKLCRMRPPFAIIWRQKKDGRVTVSLRGVGNIDCSKIAAKYGGGGHKHSAAFRLDSLKDIPWKNVN